MIASVAFGISALLWALRVQRDADAARANAIIDPLTGLFNRRGWETFVLRETARAARDGKTMTVFYMDVDDFKSVNDRLGHAAGDAVLVDIAHAVRSVARAQDVVARLGGDEFAVLATDDASETFPDGLLARWASAFRPIGVDVSIGHKGFATGADINDALGCADRAMYEAKRAKRARHAAGMQASNVSVSAKNQIRSN